MMYRYVCADVRSLVRFRAPGGATKAPGPSGGAPFLPPTSGLSDLTAAALEQGAVDIAADLVVI